MSEPPEYEWSDRESPVWSLYYEGEHYKDKPTRIFAYYASPATRNSKDTKEATFPAVVLVHGGGGTAFQEWVELWARRGYAAIAMDLAGCGPDRKRLPDGGPGQSDPEKFGAIDQPIENQWTYHAVANVILAHSLIRRFQEVDASRTAVTGISWGGYLTCIVAGLDNRFKAAVPVFFINGTNDFAYPLDSYAKTYQLVKSKRNFRITVKMPHGHKPGWAPKEIGLFVDQYLKDGISLPTVMSPKKSDGQVRVMIENQTNLTSANLHYTTGAVVSSELVFSTAKK